jgi:hypothetical protein
MAVNKTKKKIEATETAPHLNFMAGPSYDINDPLLRLRVAACSCFFGEPMYYHRDGDKKAAPWRRGPGTSLKDRDAKRLAELLNSLDPQEWRTLGPAQLLESAIDKALEHDAEATLAFAGELRNQWHIRTTPQIIMVRAAHCKAIKGTGLVRKYAPQVLKRTDEVTVQLAYQISAFGKRPIPMCLRRSWKDYLEAAGDSSLAKYRSESREVKLVDVVNLVHAKSPHIDKLMKGELKTTDQTWESVISARGSSRDTWEWVIDNLWVQLEQDQPTNGEEEVLS